MDLTEFISTTLVSIKEGISKANTQTENSFKIHSEAKGVNFDIAVEVAKEKAGEKGGKVKIHVVEAGLGGSTKTTESNISRINFTVGFNQNIA